MLPWLDALPESVVRMHHRDVVDGDRRKGGGRSGSAPVGMGETPNLRSKKVNQDWGKIEDELKFSRPENQRPGDFSSMRTSETSHPSHGIHVNPKYLEAHHQFERPDTDIRRSREVSSGIPGSGQRPITKFNDYDLDNLGFEPPGLRIVREDSPQTLALHGSSMMGQEGSFLSSQRKTTTRVSPTRIGLKRSTSPQGQRFQKSSPEKVIETASRSHSDLEFRSHRASEGDNWFGRNWTIDESIQRPSYNKYGRQRQRELIDAYGNYRGKDILNETFPKIQRVNVNGMKGEGGKMDWQNSEEEEYVWEDMSPTLADPSKRNSMLSEPNSRNCGLQANSSRPGVISPKSDFRRRSWPVPPLRDLTTTIDERIAIRDYGPGPMNKMYMDDTGNTFGQLRHLESSQHVQDYGSMPHGFHHSHDNLSPKSQAGPFHLPYLVSGVTAPSLKLHGLYGNSHNTEMPLLKLPSTSSDSINMEISSIAVQKAHQPPLSPVMWPPTHNSHPQLLSTPNLLVDNNKPIGNQQPFSAPFLQQKFDANGRKIFWNSFQETPGAFIPPATVQTPPNFARPLSSLQPQSTVLDSVLRNPVSGMAISVAPNLPDIPLLGHATMPPLPPGPPPSSSLLAPTTLNSSATSHSSVREYSGLFNSLDTANLEFNAELLKIRHESAINAMYTELPRQCTTCGLRFRSQEEHSNHMDWHVTKNRISRNRKQKPSRKWFVSAKEWLCGAETLGADAVPGFLPTETVPEQKENREMAVPADENQTVCALCGEPFEDFYSDETEEWMYRGAMYLNAPNGDIEGLGRSQLGPIVHVKCRSESAEGYGQA
ncbi:hypothetical protein KSP40_PGU011445 [Platanthera guangdongensis]|uniref:C2H2-type domain-containing protein n=1 Tax=Platanthera guangdongensis TaxID=2320717 RepID=A0ABR2MZZ9_9ASPA